ncbi:MAG: phenylalanine--tRNA ligase subunit beta [Geminicoccaceae bacterium]|nr:MAG: phenylalanine--tRNA ligase subunit beta [Geminicoccaceae bacterium]
MKFTLPWLKAHLLTDADAATIAERLTALGIEVEGIEPRGSDLDGFAVGHVTGVRQHPNADRLRLCTVETKAGTFEVVCGAPNVRLGMKGIFAPEGSVIPASGQVLKRSKIRGVESSGMLCSARELNIGDDHDGIIDLGDEPVVGTPAAVALGLEGPVFDISITPNRSDCFAVHGVARELAAAGLGRLVQPNTNEVPARFASRLRVHFDFPEEAGTPCPVFVTREFRGLTNGASPAWLQERLAASGLRPISALVDVTNWSTLDMGRPLHVFDADKLVGDLRLRLSKAGEEFLGLDGKTYTLDDGMIVICDDTGIVSLAGIMGGESTGCDETTTNVVLEIAMFDPIRTAVTGRKLGIESDARTRFERGLDPAFVLPSADYAAAMILELCGGEASDVVVAGQVPDPRVSIPFAKRELTRLTGLEVTDAEVMDGLAALGFAVASEGEGRFEVTTPSWRHDLSQPADLVEELARLRGFDAIPSVSVRRDEAVSGRVLTTSQLRRSRVRRALAARGLDEACTFSFVADDQAEAFGGAAVRLANPISADLVAMRPSLLPALAAAVAKNQARAQSDLAFFEVGAVYTGTKPGDQELTAGGVRAGLAGERHWSAKERAVDALDAKADALAALEAAGARIDSLKLECAAPGHYHPGRSGVFKLGRTVLAQFGELHPKLQKLFDWKDRVVGFEVFLDRIPEPRAAKTRARPKLVTSAFQPVDRDFAFFVDKGVAAGDLVAAVRGAVPDLVQNVALFDVYAGKGVPEGKVSMAVAVRLQALDRTLTEADIEEASGRIVAAAQACGATLRQ